MKKALSALLAVILVLSASQTVFGATKKDAQKVIESSVAFAFDGEYSKDGYSVDNSKNFYTLIKSGADVSTYKEGYLNSVKDALENGTLSGIGNLSLTLNIMYLLGVDAENFEGYNIVGLFENADPADCSGSPYYYIYATEAAFYYNLDETAEELCSALVAYYTMGAGTDFWGGWGTSPDDLGAFIIALSPYAESYSEYIEDALVLLETFNTEGGYDNGYGVNANSTAYALAAYAVTDNKKAADAAFDKLMLFYDNETGGFKSDYDEYYATADAVFGISFYLPLADNEPAGEKETTTAPPASEAVKQTAEKKSPQTGASYTAVFPAVLALGAALVALKKHRNNK